MPDIFLQSGEANATDVRLHGIGDWSTTFANVASASTNATAELATGTGSSLGVAVTDAPTLVVVAGSGVAADAGALVKPAAVLAAGVGAASNATVTTASATNASAGLAAGTGVAATAAPSTQPTLATATGTGTANDATKGDLAWGLWATTYSNSVASQATTVGGRRWPLEMTWRESRTDVSAGCATGTGSARNPTIDIVRDDDLVFILAA